LETKRGAMSKAAREAVGERMKAYWAKRKAKGKKPGGRSLTRAGLYAR
jgi:DNA invertase Pin-like site-specific DNA recombinase